MLAFGRGEIRVLVTKPMIGAWGLNWQHCNRMTYFPDHSYEQYYQAVRRFVAVRAATPRDRGHDHHRRRRERAQEPASARR